MTPLFLLQIVDTRDHKVVRLPAGGSLERDLIQFCTDAIVSKGVGFFKTEAQVKAAIAEGIADAIRELKIETKAVVR